MKSFELADKVVTRLGVVYFISFASLCGTVVLVSFLYDKIGFRNMGQGNYAYLFIGYFMTNFFSKKLLSKFTETKTAIVIGLIFYSNIILVAIYTYYCSLTSDYTGRCSATLIKFANYVFSFFQGVFGATLVWTGQYQLIDRISPQDKKKELFSKFYLILMFNVILGNLLNIIFYSFDVDSLYCFIGFYICMIGSSLSLIVVLPDTSHAEHPEDVRLPIEMSLIKNEISDTREEKTLIAAQSEKVNNAAKVEVDYAKLSIKETLERFYSMLVEPKIKVIYPYLVQSGLYQGYVSGCVYRLVVHVYNDSSDISLIKRRISLVMICYAASSMTASKIMGVNKNTNEKVMILASASFTLVMTIILLLQEYITSIFMVVAICLLFGFIDMSFNMLTNAHLSEHFPGRTEGTIVFKQFQNLFTAIFLLSYVYMPTHTFVWVFVVVNIALTIILASNVLKGGAINRVGDLGNIQRVKEFCN